MLKKPAPEIGAIGLNSTPNSGTSYSRQCTTSNVIHCVWALKAVNDVRGRASARKTGVGIWRWIYGDGFCSVCQGPKTVIKPSCTSLCTFVQNSLTHFAHALQCCPLSSGMYSGDHRSRGRYDNLWSVLRPGARFSKNLRKNPKFSISFCFC